MGERKDMHRDLEKDLIEIEAAIKSNEERDNTFTVSVLQQAYKRLKAIQWISCAEQLPPVNVYVLADVRGIGFNSESDAMMVGYFGQNGKWFYSHGMQYKVDGGKTKVVAWMSLPEAYGIQ